MKASCYYCEVPFSKIGAFQSSPNAAYIERTRDHIVPVSRGGNNTKENIVAACDRCNLLKGNRLLEEFVFFLEVLIERRRIAKSPSALVYREELERILANTHVLIEKIRPYREKLLKKVNILDQKDPVVYYLDDQRQLIDEPHEARKEAVLQVIQDRLKYPPANQQQQRSQEEFLNALRKKFPYVQEMLVKQSLDLPRWIFDNLVNGSKNGRQTVDA